MPTNSSKLERDLIPKEEKILDQENSQLLQQLRSMLVDWFNYTQSSGYYSGGGISDDGDGSITVAAGSGIIKVTDSPIGVTQFFTWSANTSLVMVDNDVNYIYVDYSAGTPVSKTTTDRSTIEQNRMFTLGRVYRSGTTIHIIQSGVLVYNFLRREHERTLTLRGFERVSGGVVTETGTRNLATTVGSFYLGLNAIATTAQDTSGADKFTYWYRDGGAGWTEVIDQTQIDNTQYDDGDGVLGTLTANRYGVHWVYIHFDSDIHVIYGQGDYTLANAEKATVPTDIPEAVSEFSILAAKIIIQKNAAAFKSVVSAYTVSLHSVFTNADAVAAVEAAGLDLASTKVITSADENLLFIFGRVAIGYDGSDDYATFAHRDHMIFGRRALVQLPAGETRVNAPTGQSVKLRINNVDKMVMSATLLTMSIPIAMGTNKITGMGDPAAAQDAATKAYSDLKLLLVGGTMSGAIAMGTNKITGMGDPTNVQDAVTKIYSDLKLLLTGGTMSGAIAMGDNEITGITNLKSSGFLRLYGGIGTGVYFYSNNGTIYNIQDGSGNFYPGATGQDLGQNSATTWDVVYYHTLTDKTCADFSQYNAKQLYDLFKCWKARTDGILHHDKTSKLYFPHIDMSTLPDEFACIADEDYDLKNMPIDIDGKIEKTATISFKKGDKCGIQQNTAFYALKDLVLKQYELIEALELRIKKLEGK